MRLAITGKMRVSWSDCKYPGLPRDFRDPVGNPVGGGLERVVGEMGVAGRHVHVAVTQQLADHRESFAKR